MLVFLFTGLAESAEPSSTTALPDSESRSSKEPAGETLISEVDHLPEEIVEAGGKHLVSSDPPSKDTSIKKSPAEVSASLPVRDLPDDLPTGEMKSGVSANAITMPQGTGKVRGMGGKFSLDGATGQGTYSLDMGGGVSLSCSSAGGWGLAGMGCNVSGGGAITVSTAEGLPRFVSTPGFDPNQDRYTADGGELVPICVVGGANGTDCDGRLLPGELLPSFATAGFGYFRARSGGGARYFQHPSRAQWLVQSQDGSVRKYGGTLANAVEANPNDSTQIVQWNLMEVDGPETDAQGNPLHVTAYRYVASGTKTFLLDVYSGTPSGGAPVDQYAFHTHVNYELRPDTRTSWRFGWESKTSLRVSGVDGTAMVFGAAPTSAREMVRRFHLTYDDAYHLSYLSQITEEGRCVANTPVEAAGLLGDSDCPTLPPVSLSYQHVAQYAAVPSDVAGHEAVVSTVQTMASSPPSSLGAQNVGLFDVNADGLPDLVVTDPVAFGGKHGVYFNKGGSFGAAQTMGVQPDSGPTDSNILKLSNPKVGTGDLLRDGLSHLLHYPETSQNNLEIFTPAQTSNGWAWSGITASPASGLLPNQKLNDPLHPIVEVDVNGDGYIDLLQSVGTEYRAYLNAGRRPGGYGQFGQYQWTGPSSANITNVPSTSCVPEAGTPIMLHESGASRRVLVADANADGFPDLVVVWPSNGRVVYFPGRGDGRFTKGDECASGGFAEDAYVVLADGLELSPSGQTMLDDVDGDGYPDLVQITATAVSIWPAEDGERILPQRHIIDLASLGVLQKNVQIVDVLGHGTRQVVFGDGGNYRYIDLTGGKQPGLLSSVANGGLETSLTYTTSTEMMLGASPAWTSVMPMVVSVVKTQISNDHRQRLGLPSDDVYEIDHSFQNPKYEQGSFLGFANSTAIVKGDSNSPSSREDSQHLLGECLDPTGAACTPDLYWQKNPREVLRGAVVATTRSDADHGQAFGTTLTTHRLTTLYTGLDGVPVAEPRSSASDSIVYDQICPQGALGPCTYGSTPTQVTVSVEREDASSSPCSPIDNQGIPSLPSACATVDQQLTVVLPSALSVRMHSVVATDVWGHQTDSYDQGVVGVDETLSNHTRWQLAPGDAGNWHWVPVEIWKEGSGAAHAGKKYSHAMTNYDAGGLGLPVATFAEVLGGLSLLRRHHDGLPVLGAPVDAFANGIVQMSKTTYDAFGNAIMIQTPGGGCREVSYDVQYHMVAETEKVHVGGLASGSDPWTCGGLPLESWLLGYDLGLQLVTDVVDLHGAETRSTYDGFGVMTALFRPDPDTGAVNLNAPAMTTTYVLATDAVPSTTVTVQGLIGLSGMGQPVYTTATSISDSAGQLVASFVQADPAAGDAGAWVVTPGALLDGKGAAKESYRSFFSDAGPDSSALTSAAPPGTASLRTQYDASGRPVASSRGNGLGVYQPTSSIVYRAQETDSSDALALAGKALPKVVQHDGHGRSWHTIELVSGAQGPEQNETISTLGVQGETEVLTRHHAGNPDVVRWMVYDTLGRRVGNFEPDFAGYAPPGSDPSTTGGWRYAYNASGEMVGTSDPRGCGSNFSYDRAGRIVSEKWSPCLASQSSNAWVGTLDSTTGIGADVFYRYDEYSPTATLAAQGFYANGALWSVGNLVSVMDHGARVDTVFDARGRVRATAKMVARPGTPAIDPAQRYQSAPFVSTATYDVADRPIVATTGASVVLGTNGQSQMQTTYSARGLVTRVDSSYGTLLSGEVYDATGRPIAIHYGDALNTTSTLTYDPVSQLLAQALTTRGALSDPQATAPTVLEHMTVTRDAGDRPTDLLDHRVAAEWLPGFKPVHRTMTYDAQSRISQVTAAYGAQGAIATPQNDVHASPFAYEADGGADPRRATPAQQQGYANRVRSQSYVYDWLGNATSTSDDQGVFPELALGTVTNGSASSGPYQLKQALLTTGASPGQASASYDEAGNLASLAVTRLCAGTPCNERFEYSWDEAGHLSQATRWDAGAADPSVTQTGAPAARLSYVYDVRNMRVLKVATDEDTQTTATTVYAGGVELRRATWIVDAADDTQSHYDDSQSTEVVSLGLARAEYEPAGPVDLPGGPGVHVYLEGKDFLGSSSWTVDLASGELVEHTTYLPFGQTESDYRPERWRGHREDYRFTGKEEDIEVGLQYFGQRYFQPLIGRWVSADPLTIHSLGADLNAYAYIHGNVFGATDPNGLDETTLTSGGGPDTCAAGPSPPAAPIMTANRDATAGEQEAPSDKSHEQYDYATRFTPTGEGAGSARAEEALGDSHASQTGGKASNGKLSVDFIAAAEHSVDLYVQHQADLNRWLAARDVGKSSGQSAEQVLAFDETMFRMGGAGGAAPVGYGDAQVKYVNNFGHMRGVQEASALAPMAVGAVSLASQVAMRAELLAASQGAFANSAYFDIGATLGSRAPLQTLQFSTRTPVLTALQGANLGEDMARAGYDLVLGKWPGNVQFVDRTLGTFTIDRPWGWTPSYNMGAVRGALEGQANVTFTSHTYTGMFDLEARQIFGTALWAPKLVI